MAANAYDSPTHVAGAPTVVPPEGPPGEEEYDEEEEPARVGSGLAILITVLILLALGLGVGRSTGCSAPTHRSKPWPCQTS